MGDNGDEGVGRKAVGSFKWLFTKTDEEKGLAPLNPPSPRPRANPPPAGNPAPQTAPAPSSRISRLSGQPVRTSGGSEIRSTPAATTVSAAPPPPVPAEVVINPDDDAAIRQALEGASTPGYEDFLAQLDALTDAMPDVPETRRVAAAIKTVARTKNISPEQLVAAVEERLRILEQTRTTFDQDLEDDLTAETEERLQRVSALDQQIREMETQIAGLEQQKGVLVGEKDRANQEVGELEQRKNLLQAQYHAACDLHARVLAQVKEKLQTHS